MLDVLLEVLRDDGGKRDVARLATLDYDAAEPPAEGEVSGAEGRNGLATHASETEDEEDSDIKLADGGCGLREA